MMATLPMASQELNESAQALKHASEKDMADFYDRGEFLTAFRSCLAPLFISWVSNPQAIRL